MKKSFTIILLLMCSLSFAIADTIIYNGKKYIEYNQYDILHPMAYYFHINPCKKPITEKMYIGDKGYSTTYEVVNDELYIVSLSTFRQKDTILGDEFNDIYKLVDIFEEVFNTKERIKVDWECKTLFDLCNGEFIGFKSFPLYENFLLLTYKKGKLKCYKHFTGIQYYDFVMEDKKYNRLMNKFGTSDFNSYNSCVNGEIKIKIFDKTTKQE